jgi:DNA helicase-2/ATP-dependent DNA helicase PcrA
MANSRGGTQPRALNARRDSSGWGSSLREAAALPPAPVREKATWANAITGSVRDNGDLVLVAGDRIRHTDFGDGRVTAVTGEGPKRVAEVQFDTAGRKRLLIKIAPIEKI